MDATLDELSNALALAHDAGDKKTAMSIAEEIDNLERFSARGYGKRALKQGAHGLIEGTYGAAREVGAMAPFGPVGPVPPFLVPDQVQHAVGDKIKEVLPHTSEINNMLAKLGIDLSVPPPKDTIEKIIDPGAQFAGAMLPGPAEKAGTLAGPVMRWLGPMAKRAGVGVGAGEAGAFTRSMVGDATQDTKYGKWGPQAAGLAAELATLIGPGALMARTANTTKALKPAIEGYSEEAIRAADARRQETAQFLKTPVLLSQAFEDRGPLTGLNERMVQSEGGTRAQKTFADQLVSAMAQAKKFASSPTTGTTGFADANAIAQVGKTAENVPNAARRAATEPLFDLANQEPIHRNEVIAMINELDAVARRDAMHKGTTARAAIDQAQADLKAALKAASGATPEPLTTGGVGRFAKEAAMKKESLFATGADKSAAHAHDEIYKVISDRLRATAGGAPKYPLFDDAMNKFAQMSGDVVAMKRSPMQAAFPESMRESGIGDFDNWSRMLLNPSVEADTVKNIARNLRPHGPEAFPTIVKKAWTDTLEAASSEVGGLKPELAPGTFAKVIAGPKGSKTREKFLATVQEMGMDQATAERMIDAFETISRGRQGVGGINPAWLEHAAGTNPLSSGMRAPGLIVGGSPAAAAMENVIKAKTMGHLVDLMTDPKWVNEVVRISKYSPTMRRFQTALVGMMGMAGGNAEVKPEELSAEIFKMPKGTQ